MLSISTAQRRELMAGISAELPIALSVMPFGLIFGVIAVDAGLPAWMAISMSSIIFAGSAQFLAALLIAESAPVVVLLLSVLVINLRHLLYSASLAPHAQHLSRRWRWLLSYVLTDEAFAPTVLRYEQNEIDPAASHYFWLGAGVTLWIQWQVSTVIGVFLGRGVPPEWGFAFTLSLTFIGIIVPTIITWPLLGAALAASVVGILTISWPYKLGLMLAAAIGIATGLLLETIVNE